MTLSRGSVAASVLLCTGVARSAPVPSAGQAAADHAQPSPPATAPSAGGATASPFPIHTWELPPLDVVGEERASLKEDERIGEYAQPRWSARRRFPTTRTYVMPKGEVETEYWMRYTAPIKSLGDNREIRSYYELGFGLGHRLQLDVYVVTQQVGHSAIEINREQIEVRYALADYGKIWGNPTLYLEWQHRNGENDWLEPKILLGGEIAPRWHAGFNMVLEREIGGKQESEWDLTGGVSYTAVDEVFHTGVELYAEVHDTKSKRFAWGDTEQLFLGGPSFMVSPIPPFNLLVAPLFGVGKNGAAPGEKLQGMFRLWFVTGWAF